MRRYIICIIFIILFGVKKAEMGTFKRNKSCTQSFHGKHCHTHKFLKKIYKAVKKNCYCLTRALPVEGLLGCRLPPQTPQNRNLKNIDFVDIMIQKVLCDLPLSQNQPLKLADD
jgi:hypothetical protein